MPIHDAGRLEMMSDMFDDDSGSSSDSGSCHSGKHCNEWLDSSDSRCPNYGSER